LWFSPIVVLGAAAGLSVPVGLHLTWIFDGAQQTPGWLRRIESWIDTGPQTWMQYAAALLYFNTALFVVAFVVLATQQFHPAFLNPDGKGALAPTTIFHTAFSFVANNSQQHYSGEQHLSYASQLVAIVWAMFTGGGTGLCAFAAVVRGLRGDPHLGNFYLDLWRIVAYAIVPISVAVGIFLIATGVPMTLEGAAVVSTMEGSVQTIARGPVAALVPVKNLASVGGGFFGANSAHPFESPTAITNLIECITILLFPAGCVVAFGRMLRCGRHAFVLYAVMQVMLVAMVAWAVASDEDRPNSALTERPSLVNAAGRPFSLDAVDINGQSVTKEVISPALAGLPVDQAEFGNLEGKELRFGTGAAGTYVAVTTAVSCGSVNCAHDSLNPLAGLTPLIGMWLNCVFGGKGVGLLNLLVFLIVTVFLTGLMVGRTPEYLGKKVEAREMKLAMLALLIHPLIILVPSALFAGAGWANASAGNPGPHGLTETVYEFSSAASGNGSGCAGLGNTFGFNDPSANLNPPAPFAPHWDIACGIVIVLGRYLSIIAVLALAASLGAKHAVPPTVGTLRTDTVTFGLVLLGVILLLGALLFLPLAALGPVAEQLGPIPFGR
jgi:potassium-transporting ATPase potassium-binding subunit